MNIRKKILKSIDGVKSYFAEVEINYSAIDQISLKVSKVDTLTWDYPFIYTGPIERVYNYFLIFSALSFYYWGTPKWYKTFNEEKLGGSESLFFCLTDSINKGYDFTDVNFVNSLDYNTFRRLFKGVEDTELPLIHNRFEIIKEIGKVLSTKYKGGFLELCESVRFDASSVVEKLPEEFKYFDDRFTYKGHEVYFYKKAQESVSLISEYYLNKSQNLFLNINSLTASSDYKLPQILISVGVLKISDNLRVKLNSQHIFVDTDEEIIEIRALTILAVELIAKKTNLTPTIISNRLWNLSQDKTEINIAYPKIASSLI